MRAAEQRRLGAVVATAPVLGACGKPACRDGDGEAVGFAVLILVVLVVAGALLALAVLAGVWWGKRREDAGA